jgi:hypothetical protein
VYGWVVAITFVFFYNLWPTLAVALLGQTPMKTTALKG